MDRATRPTTCRLCGHAFDAAALACHAGCPLGSRCSLICCPNCGYQTVDESRSVLARLLRRAVGSASPAPPRARPFAADGSAAVPLAHVSPGIEVEVRGVEVRPGEDPGRLGRLAAYGIAPGSAVRVVQRRPATILRAGETELALADELVDRVWVTAPEPSR
jgi:Fe2+ transport system protein FeoA